MRRLRLTFWLCVTLAAPAVAGPQGATQPCRSDLDAISRPQYGRTTKRFTHQTQDGPIEFELRSQRVRASDQSEILRMTLHRTSDGEEVGVLTFEFLSLTEGKFRGVDVHYTRAGLGTLLYQEMARHPEFQTIERISTKYIDDNEWGMRRSLEAVDIITPSRATPQQLMDALTALDSNTGKPYVPSTSLWAKIGFRPAEVKFERSDDQFRVVFERNR